MQISDAKKTVTTSLGQFGLHRFRGKEELSRCFEYQVDLVNEDETLDLTALVGQPMTVSIELPDSGVRYFHGMVTRFHQIGWQGRNALYRATLRPWLWIMGHRANCRIFQNKSIPDIIKALFREHGFTDFSESLSGTYNPVEFKVQYRETDLNFVSRLMEDAGIYYFFKHEDGKHTLVLADSSSAHSAASGYATIPFYVPSKGNRRERDHLTTWSWSEGLEPGAVALTDYDFVKPKSDLLVKLQSSHEGAVASREIFDYPGTYTTTADGQNISKVRLEALVATRAVAEAEGNAGGIAVGFTFTLSKHPRDDQNLEYLVISTEVEVLGDSFESGGPTPTEFDSFKVRLQAVPNSVPYRSAQVTPIPRVYGPQTATVVGKSGEEIWTDEHGRVKLQFRWDREGQSNENSSCWVRVAQLWAGAAWGGMQLPRMGQEVIVEFLEGDPDRPIVTGRVYNGENKVPYTLPANQTQSGVKSRSTKQGTADNFNELRFEDKKGSEQVFFQAEKDLVSNIKNDETRDVGHDRKTTIKNDETVMVEGKRTETVKKDETITIEGKRTETVKKDETITIEGARIETVKKDETITIEGKRTETVKKDETITIEGANTVKITKDQTMTISGAQTLTITKDQSVKVDGARSHTIAKDDTYTVKSLVVSATSEISFKVGAATLTMKSSGAIELKGVNVTVNGQGQVEVKAGGIAKVSGAMVQVG